MPSIGPLEILIVAVIALIVFGPQKLPEMARAIGHALAEFRRQANDIRSEFADGLDDEPERREPGPGDNESPTETSPPDQR